MEKNWSDGALSQMADGTWIGTVELTPGEDGNRRRKRVHGKTQIAALEKLEDLLDEMDGRN